MDNIARLDNLISGAARAVVVVHTHPDGDAVGSGLALVDFLTSCRDMEALLIVPDGIPESLHFMMHGRRGKSLMAFEDNPAKAKRRIGQADLIFCLDCNSFSRTNPAMEAALRASSAPKVLIDHHLDPEKEAFDLVFSKTNVSSASELLYWTLKKLPGIDGNTSEIPRRCLASLLTGMTTDTNNFANSVYPGTLRMASEIIARGVDRASILEHLYNSYRENRLRLMGVMLHERLKITPEGAAFMILDKGLQQEYDFQHGDSEGFVNLPLAIEKVRMSIMLTEEEDRFRVSVRSKQGTSANLFAQSYFHGGGHELASGGKLFFPQDIPSPADAKAYILKVIGEFFGT